MNYSYVFIHFTHPYIPIKDIYLIYLRSYPHIFMDMNFFLSFLVHNEPIKNVRVIEVIRSKNDKVGMMENGKVKVRVDDLILLLVFQSDIL